MNGEAIAAFDEVLHVTSAGNYQVSEIVARAHYRKGVVLGRRMGQTQEAREQFRLAARIWEHYDEENLAAEAEWQEIVVSGELTRRRIRSLEREDAIVRCSATRLYRERKRRKSRGVAAQRSGDDDTVWKNLVRQTKRNLALRSGAD